MITAYELLAAHPFMAGIPDRYLSRMALYAHRAVFHAGARVFNEGGHADRFWLIRDGQVDLDATEPGRGRIVIDTIDAGQVLGWSWLFPPYRWHFGASAVGPVLAVALDGPGIRAVCAAEPALGHDLTTRLMQVVVARMQATRARLLDPGAVAPRVEGTAYSI
ncbi:cyclic nucleotide-binding domain-containing protein [Dactylosporangium sp. AC04546]|uniref:cyclic nucleotide-binding domain-containing protein n=1 Tax=Dactylosporangium sp. AC04546 TaxID=2862460 RepID=UPI001EE0E6FC|nr:cyclic nucleotide-binding domain-containing protein [Dactylosporangium sp. AC04546]WVK78558.1 cyclic nucleotide-binding domain-containing protein [Dactylosporangium sp. AC04546]